MRTQAEKAAAFRALHQKPGCFLIPNPWDAGTAKILTGLGYEALATTSLGVANNLYTQIGLVLLIALSAKNAILIVEVARERRILHGDSVLAAAVEAARTRFRPILMTSFAFILGVVPLVTATGAGANSRASLGLSVFSGMIASTCLAVLFVPSFFVLFQRFEEWRTARKQRVPAQTAA